MNAGGYGRIVLTSGLWGVLATPFDQAGSTVDAASMVRQVRLHQSAGSVGLVALGVFGEGARLNAAEKQLVIRTVRQAAPDLPLVIGMPELEGDALCASAEALLDAGGPHTRLMVQINTSDPTDLAEHLEMVSRRTGAELVVQDYPALTGITMPAADLAQVIRGCPTAVAVKSEAPPTAPAIATLAAAVPVPVFGGLGGVGVLDELMAGAAGAMTGFSHPEALAATLAAFGADGYPRARDVLLPWLPLINFEGQARVGLAIRKASLAARGILDWDTVRAPGVAMPASMRPLLRRHLAAVSGLAQAHRAGVGDRAR